MKPWNPIQKDSRYVIYNYKDAIDMPGEWYLDKAEGYIYYMPREGEDMAAALCIAPALHQTVVIRGHADRSAISALRISLSATRPFSCRVWA